MPEKNKKKNTGTGLPTKDVGNLVDVDALHLEDMRADNKAIRDRIKKKMEDAAKKKKQQKIDAIRKRRKGRAM